MVASEVEGVAGKQADGTAKTCEAKVIVRCRADSRDPVTGAPRKDKGSGAAGVRIDSAKAVDGAGRTSEFAGRLEWFGLRNGAFEAKELAALSDGAAWIRNVCEEIFPGRRAACVLDQFHALEYAAASAGLGSGQGRAEGADGGDQAAIGRRAGRLRYRWPEAAPRPGRSRRGLHRLLRGQQGPDACDRCRERGLPVGSGVVESACKQIVGSRFKRSGCRWSKAGANALLAAECCIENNRWADFLDWRAGRAAAV